MLAAFLAAAARNGVPTTHSLGSAQTTARAACLLVPRTAKPSGKTSRIEMSALRLPRAYASARLGNKTQSWYPKGPVSPASRWTGMATWHYQWQKHKLNKPGRTKGALNLGATPSTRPLHIIATMTQALVCHSACYDAPRITPTTQHQYFHRPLQRGWHRGLATCRCSSRAFRHREDVELLIVAAAPKKGGDVGRGWMMGGG